ncbi:hypothetical protein [Pseudomonas sp. NPDC089569]|uniref:hypothetical protein n=1 Tax=Pseudomonas sp. NPDC089569 TaxID=3390722 RepID=UPI003D0281B9
MTDNQAKAQSEQRLALPASDQLAILVTFQAGAKYGLTLVEITKRYLEQSRNEEVKLAWHACMNELQLGSNFAGALEATCFFSSDVQRIMNILLDLQPATEAAIEYLSAVTLRKLH